MSLALLVAIFLAFGIGDLSPPIDLGQSLEAADPFIALILGKLLGAIAGCWFAATLIGRLIAWRASVLGRPTRLLRRCYVAAVYLIDALNLLVFAWILLELNWSEVVASRLGLRNWIVIDDAMILLPFLVGQVMAWVGLHAAEIALHPRDGEDSRRPLHQLFGALINKTRRSMGLILAISLIFDLAHDLISLAWPAFDRSPSLQLVGMLILGTGFLLGSPALIRLSWPTRPLPDSPLRTRLERAARRHRFRFTDLLVWDTGGAVLNAGVTGVLPWYRYVLISDAMIDLLDDRQIEAVFGHEIGHVAHGHLVYFGLFFLGSLGVVSLCCLGVDLWALRPWILEEENRILYGQFVGLGVMALYYGLVFGALSRLFERQADLYGCRMLSCGSVECPPHCDLDGSPIVVQSCPTAAVPTSVCPVGVRVFALALEQVAFLNGLDPNRWSWRHGSIAQRIRSLERFARTPKLDSVFQHRTRRLCHILGLGLLVASAVAWYSGAYAWLT